MLVASYVVFWLGAKHCQRVRSFQVAQQCTVHNVTVHIFTLCTSFLPFLSNSSILVQNLTPFLLWSLTKLWMVSSLRIVQSEEVRIESLECMCYSHFPRHNHQQVEIYVCMNSDSYLAYLICTKVCEKWGKLAWKLNTVLNGNGLRENFVYAQWSL